MKKEMLKESGKLLIQIVKLTGLVCVLVMLIKAIIDMI